MNGRRRLHSGSQARLTWLQRSKTTFDLNILFWKRKKSHKTKSAEAPIAESPTPVQIEVYPVPVNGIDHTLRLTRTTLHEIQLYFVLSTVNPATAPCIEPNPHQGPLLVSEISRHWREVALGTPALWSAIYVGNKPHVSLLKLWLKRSGSKEPLFLKIHTAFDGQLTHWHPHLLPIVLDIFAGQIQRWKTFEIVLSSLAWSEPSRVLPFYGLPFAKAIRLEALSVHDLNNQTSRLLDTITSIPSLWYFHLDGVRRASSHRLIAHKMWFKLTGIRLGIGISMDEAVWFLCWCTNALEVTLDCITEIDTFEDHLPPPTRTLLHLRSLRVKYSACDCIPLLLCFSLPALEVLQLHNFRSTIGSVRCLENALSNSRGLKQLSIIDDFMEETVLWNLVRSARLDTVSCVGIYTTKNIEWDILLGIVTVGDQANMPRSEADGARGAWFGWGPASLADTHTIH